MQKGTEGQRDKEETGYQAIGRLGGGDQDVRLSGSAGIGLKLEIRITKSKIH